MDKGTPILAKSEIEDFYKEIEKYGKLFRLQKSEEYTAFRSLIEDTIKEIDSVSNIKATLTLNDAVEVRAKQIAILFIQGILDSMNGAEASLEFYNDQIKKIAKVEDSKSKKDYGKRKQTFR